MGIGWAGIGQLRPVIYTGHARPSLRAIRETGNREAAMAVTLLFSGGAFRAFPSRLKIAAARHPPLRFGRSGAASRLPVRGIA